MKPKDRESLGRCLGLRLLLNKYQHAGTYSI